MFFASRVFLIGRCQLRNKHSLRPAFSGMIDMKPADPIRLARAILVILV
jgi:hypothetical protein